MHKIKSLFYKNPVIYSILGFFILAGLILQLHNISNYKVYPDSYQSVAVAQNLKDHHSLAAPLGQNGLEYPDFFGWTRPVYPLLIVFFSFFVLSLFTAAHIVNTLAGSLAIIAVYGFIKTVFKSRKAGLVAALLLTISYSRVVWGGFIFTEPLGILMLSLALWRLWSQRDNPDEWFSVNDLLTGAIFAAAILTRYEYVALLIPATLLAGNGFMLKRSTTIASSALLVSAIVLAILHPFTGGWDWVWNQINSLVFLILGIFAAIAVGYTLYKRRVIKVKDFDFWTTRIASSLLVIISALIILDHEIFPALHDFATNEPLITAASIVGMLFLLLGTKLEKELGLVTFAGGTIMALVYYHSNSHMDRYITHLLPIMLIPASYAVIKFFSLKYRQIVVYILILCLCLQVVKTWNGLHKVDYGIWFQPGYEEVSAKKLKGNTGDSNLLLASMPEPYYLFTGVPTQSVADQAPYIFSNIPPDTKITIVEDEGMRAIFPHFTHFIDKSLGQYEVSHHWVNTPFRYTTTITPEKYPVNIYEIKAADLNKIIAATI
jgi:hypothetical protein